MRRVFWSNQRDEIIEDRCRDILYTNLRADKFRLMTTETVQEKGREQLRTVWQRTIDDVNLRIELSEHSPQTLQAYNTFFNGVLVPIEESETYAAPEETNDPEPTELNYHPGFKVTQTFVLKAPAYEIH